MTERPRDWSTGAFRALRGKRCWQVICPAGECIELGFSGDPLQDELQAKFLAHSGNLGLFASVRAKKSRECPNCKGTGKTWGLAGHNVSDCIEVDCDTCRGTGRIV